MIKKRDLYNAQTVISNIFNTENDNIELAFTLIPMFRSINNTLAEIEKSKQLILTDTAEKDKNGKVRQKEVGGIPKYVLDPNKTKEFEDRFNYILDEEVEIEGRLPIELAKEMKMSLAELTVLEFLFKK